MGGCCILGVSIHRSLHLARNRVRVEDMVNSAVSVPVLPDGARAQWDLKFMWSVGWPRGPPLCRGCAPCCLGYGMEHVGLLASRVNALLDSL